MLTDILVAFVVAMILTQVAAFDTSIYLHRSLTHTSLTLHPAVAWMFRFTLWITTGMSRREWTGVHRKHHAHTDRESDPHSPLVLGFWKVQLWNVGYYIRATRDKESIAFYTRDIKNDVWDRLFFNHGRLGPLAGIVGLVVIMGWRRGLLAALIHAITYVFILSSSINGLCHWIGYKNFSDNSATNIPLVAWLSAGEGWHNNHHGRQQSPKFSFRRGEFDPSWPIISLMLRLGWARAKRV